jgi:Ca2+-binding EF-hand superfamily protein
MTAIERSGFEISDVEFNLLMTKLDIDGSNTLDYAEFMRFLQGEEGGFWKQGPDDETRQQLETIGFALRNQISRYSY